LGCNYPPTAKFVVLAGPNGNGKSSLFDVFLNVADRGIRNYWDQTYHAKISEPNMVPAPDGIDIASHEEPPTDPESSSTSAPPTAMILILSLTL